MSDVSETARDEPFVRLDLDRDESLQLLRALDHAYTHVVDAARPCERFEAAFEAQQYSVIRARLLDEVARREVLRDESDED